MCEKEKKVGKEKVSLMEELNYIPTDLDDHECFIVLLMKSTFRKRSSFELCRGHCAGFAHIWIAPSSAARCGSQGKIGLGPFTKKMTPLEVVVVGAVNSGVRIYFSETAEVVTYFWIP